MGLRRYQEMAVVVREPIEKHDGMGRSHGYQISTVVLAPDALTNEAVPVASRTLRRSHVRQSPRRPQLIHYKLSSRTRLFGQSIP